MGARAMPQKTQRKIKPHVVTLVTIIGNSHCYSPVGVPRVAVLGI
jgi:hypothetical protein